VASVTGYIMQVSQLSARRRAFQASLDSERVHFVNLSAALARVKNSPASIFADLRNYARKIGGTAAMSEIAEVAAAARALERASISASMSHAENTDPAVWGALAALVGLLEALGDGDDSVKASAAD
jgi:hypothetical protein